jgi:hypothetical protein
VSTRESFFFEPKKNISLQTTRLKPTYNQKWDLAATKILFFGEFEKNRFSPFGRKQVNPRLANLSEK